jgi:hypothetical protein
MTSFQGKAMPIYLTEELQRVSSKRPSLSVVIARCLPDSVAFSGGRISPTSGKQLTLFDIFTPLKSAYYKLACGLCKSASRRRRYGGSQAPPPLWPLAFGATFGAAHT